MKELNELRANLIILKQQEIVMLDLKNKLYTDIARVLIEKYPLNPKEIHEILKSRGNKYTYKYIYKTIRIMEEYKLLNKLNSKYQLNTEYIKSLRDFSIKASNAYSIDQNVFIESLMGNMLKLFSKDEAEKITKNLKDQLNKKMMEKLNEWYAYYYDPEKKEIKTIITETDLKNKNVLEVGCGTGRLTLELAKYCKEVIAIDHNEIAIEYCKEKYHNQKNITFLHKDIENLKNFNDTDFEIIITSWIGLHHAKDQEKIIENIYKLLKKDGTLLIIEAYPDSEYIQILNMLRPKESKMKEMQTKLRTGLFKKFKNLNEKIVNTKYLFPNYERLEETFKIELVYEEDSYWNESDSLKLKEYINKKKEFTVQEAFILLKCEKSTNQ